MVFGGGLIFMAVGMLWYSPFLFGKMWMRLSGIDPVKVDRMKKAGMGKTYFAALLVALLMSAALYYFYGLTEVGDTAEALMLAFALWVGFVATTLAASVLWESRPFTLYLINSGNYLIALSLVSLFYFLFSRL